MPLLFLLAIIFLPLIEITIFVEVGSDIGAFPVVALTVFTAAAGLALVRAQGLDTLKRAQRELDAGRPPVAELMHGALLALAGLLLLIPGFLTDGLGALLLLPPLRRRVIHAVLRRVRTDASDVVIEGEFWESDSDRRSLDDGSDRHS